MLPEETDAPLEEPFVVASNPLPRAREPFWGYVELASVVGLLLLAAVLIGAVALAFVVFYPGLRTDQTQLIVPTNLAFYLALYLIFRIVLGQRYGKPVFASLGWCPTTRAAIAGAVLAAAPLAFAVNGIAYLLHTPKVATPFDNIAQSPVLLALVGGMAVSIAPLFEELFFRGFLQPLLSRTFGIVAGVLLTAVLFGALHAAEYQFVWQYVVAISLVGVALGIVRVVTKSIIPSTIMHGCYNASFVIVLAITKHP
jgi:uncharacterized protein